MNLMSRRIADTILFSIIFVYLYKYNVITKQYFRFQKDFILLIFLIRNNFVCIRHDLRSSTADANLPLRPNMRSTVILRASAQKYPSNILHFWCIKNCTNRRQSEPITRSKNVSINYRTCFTDLQNINVVSVFRSPNAVTTASSVFKDHSSPLS